MVQTGDYDQVFIMVSEHKDELIDEHGERAKEQIDSVLCFIGQCIFSKN